MSNEKPIAYLRWSLDVECPNCKENLDLSESPHDDDGAISRPIFNNDWSRLKDETIYCSECEFEFEIAGAEH